MAAGAGDDIYAVDTQSDLVFENAGEGVDSVISSVSFYLYPHVENLTLTGVATFGVGNDLANTLIGNAGENLLIGGDGSDTVRGGDARDALFGVDGDDVLSGEAGIDYIVAGAGNDSIFGGTDADEAYGQEGNDFLSGGDDFATDILVGGDGNDTLDGGPAWDLMYGGAGDDVYFVSQQVDWVFEQPGEGTDSVMADSPNGYYLYANVENLTLLGNTPFGVGNELGNVLLGNAVDNTLLGGAGNDTLDGGAGTDILWGQDGSDTFRISKGTGLDIIADFQVRLDTLDLSAYGLSSITQARSLMTQVGGDISMNLGNGDALILLGVNVADFGGANLKLDAEQRATALNQREAADGLVASAGDASTGASRSDAGSTGSGPWWGLSAAARPGPVDADAPAGLPLPFDVNGLPGAEAPAVIFLGVTLEAH